MSRGSPVDHYRTLGIAPDAGTREIRRAYRRLARQHHPDTSPAAADDACRFMAITDAYQTLSDPAARASYDRALTPTFSPHPRPQPTGGPHRVGILELSLQEATHLTHHPLILTDGTTTIRLPAGLGHGDTISLHGLDHLTVLQIQVNAWT